MERKLEEFNPFMVADGERLNDGEERNALLYDQIKHSSSVECLPGDIKEILDEFSEAFSVADTELTQTNAVEMNIDTETTSR